MRFNKFCLIIFLITLGLILPLKSYEAQTVSDPNLLGDLISQNDWQTLSSKSGFFTIQMPGIPEQYREKTELLGNKKDWHLFKLKNNNNTYIIGYLELSETEIVDGSKDAVNSIKQIILEPLGLGELQSDGKAISLNNYPGKEFLTINSNQIIALRIYLVDNRLYGLFAKSDNLKNINKYFNSFEFNDIWQPFTSQTGEFTVKLPNQPTEEIEKMLVSEQEIIWNILTSKDFSIGKNDVDELENIYAVGYTDLPANLNQEERKELLNKIRLSLLKTLNLDLLNNSYREIYDDNSQGIEFMGITNDQLFAFRVYENNNRLYGLFTAGYDLNKIDKFLESFQLL